MFIKFSRSLTALLVTLFAIGSTYVWFVGSANAQGVQGVQVVDGVQVHKVKKPRHIGANWDNRKSYTERGVKYYLKDKKQASGYNSKGLATWYCCYRKGTKTADGTLYGKDKLTAAHKTLPFGTLVKVTNTKNKKYVVVEITDRGPFAKGKIIDLTPGAFSKIEAKSMGVAQVELEVIGFKY